MPTARTHAPVLSGLVWIATGLQCALLVWIAADNYGWARLGQVLVAFFVEPIALGVAFFGAKGTGLPRAIVVAVLACVTVALLQFLPWGAAC
jgi:hypothetical protein